MNALINAAFSRNRTVLLLLAFLLLAGVLAYKAIPKESNPDVAIPIIYVSMHHEGISPEDAERLLVKPMEKELQGISGIKVMKSTASESHASVLLEFDAGFDSDTALLDVREKVDVAKSQLPAATDEPTVNEVNLALFPVVNISMSGSLPERALLAIARDLKDKLEALPGVMNAEIAGKREELLEVIIDPVVMETYNVDLGTLFQLIADNNLLVAAGAIDTGAGRMLLKVPGIIESIDDIQNMPVKVIGDNVITFSDVATIRRTFKDPTGFARLDGQPTLALEVSKRIGANIIETIDSVKAVVEENRELWPPNLNVGIHQDQSKQTKVMLTDLQNNVLSGVVLVMIVITAALGLRSSLLVGLAIPGSFLTGILVIHTLGYTMNVIVLFSLILVVGMLVDGAIIVVELADRNIEAGLPKKQAFAESAKRMSWPIIASTFTTLAVFAPLLFWPGLIGQFMRYMPITVLTCLLASLSMALVFIPVLGGLIGRNGRADTSGKRVEFKGEYHSMPKEKPRGLLKGYMTILAKLLLHPAKTFLAILVFTILTYVLYGFLGRGVEFFPDIEPEVLMVQVHARGDLSIHEKNRIVRQIENRLIGKEEIVSVYGRSFEAPDNNLAADVVGTVQIELTEWDSRRKAAELIPEWREEMADIAGIQLQVRALEGGPDNGKPINIEISAANTEKMHEATQYVRDLMDEVGGFADTEDDRPLPGIEWILEVDREQAARYGASVALVGNVIQLVTNGIMLAEYRPDNSADEIEIRVRYPIDQRNLSQLNELRVPASNGMVPATNFVTLQPAQRTGIIQRVDATRVITIQSDVAEGYLADDILKQLKDKLANGKQDPEVGVNFKGEAAEQLETMIFLLTAFISALFVMTLILLTQFNSFYQALLVMSAILFSTAGVLLGLMITGQTFGIVMVGLGIIALSGIVVNNNIVLIDTYNGFRASGASALSAALQTGALRMRPVLLTAVTTILGLMPMVLAMNINLISRDISFGAPSTQWWKQLASAIAGGLAFTTLLTLFMTPCLLVLGARISAGIQSRRQKRHEHRAQTALQRQHGDTQAARPQAG